MLNNQEPARIKVLIITEKNAIPKLAKKLIQYEATRGWPDVEVVKKHKDTHVRFSYYCYIGWADPDAEKDESSWIRHAYYEMNGYANFPNAKDDPEWFIALLYHRAIRYTDPDAKQIRGDDRYRTIPKEYFLHNLQDLDAKSFADESVRKAYYRHNRWQDPDAGKDINSGIQITYYRVHCWKDYSWLSSHFRKVKLTGFLECLEYPDTDELRDTVMDILVPVKDGLVGLQEEKDRFIKEEDLNIFRQATIKYILCHSKNNIAMLLLVKYPDMKTTNYKLYEFLVKVLKQRKVKPQEAK